MKHFTSTESLLVFSGVPPAGVIEWGPAALRLELWRSLPVLRGEKETALSGGDEQCSSVPGHCRQGSWCPYARGCTFLLPRELCFLANSPSVHSGV